MATKTAIKKLKTLWKEKRVFPMTPKLHRKSQAKAVSNFYGQPIKKGGLHKDLGVSQGRKIPLSAISSKLATIKKKKKKTAKDVKEERRLVFAKNAKTKFGK